MIRWLVNNVSLMILALVLATVVWIVAALEQDPLREDVFPTPIPIEVQNLPAEMQILGNWTSSVHVTVRALESTWSELTVDHFQARIDLNGLAAGSHTLPVQVNLQGIETARIVKLEPVKVSLKLDQVRAREVEVRLEISGEPALGFRAKEPAIDPEIVTVSGPASQVEKVTQATTQLSLRGEQQTIEEDGLLLLPRDAEGNLVDGVKLKPERVHVRVPIELLGGYRVLPVTINQTGQPAAGYRVTELKVEPSSVTIFGTALALNDLKGYVQTVQIPIDGATDDVTERVALDLPQGVAVVVPEEPSVLVTIKIEPFLDSIKVKRQIRIQGLRTGLQAQLSPSEVELILTGPLPRLDSLRLEEVVVFVNLTEFILQGTYEVELQVVKSEELAYSITPEAIQVEITQAPAPPPQE